MSLVSGLQSLATRIANELRDAVKPRLLPPGGNSNQILTKTTEGDYAVGWTDPASGDYNDLTNKPTLGTAAAKNIYVGSTEPVSPVEGDIWIDTSGS